MKQNFSIEEHDEASTKLQKIRDYLTYLTCDLSNSYSGNTGLSQKAHKAAKAVDELRFALADELHKEAPQGLEVGALDFYQRQNKYKGNTSSDVDI